MSDPTIGSQSARQNLGLANLSKPAVAKPADAPKTEVAQSASPSGSEPKQRLTSFLNKLETTWQLFNKGTRENDVLPKGKTAYLEDSEVPSQASLKELRARVSKAPGEYQLGKTTTGASAKPGEPKASPSSDSSSSTKANAKATDGRNAEAPARSTARGHGPSSAASKPPSTPLPRPTTAWQPSGLASSRSFLATAQMAGAQLRSSDAAGRPGAPVQAEALARQPVFSQNLAQVNSRVTNRHISSHLPIHNAFLDEHHANQSGTASPLRLPWGAPPKPPTASKNLLNGQPRLSLSSPRSEGGNSVALGAHLSLNSAALSSARADIASRFAGKAIHSLLKKLYDEEELEELDEEEAVSGLSLILRLGGEFTYEHSTRVLDLALELADEVGIQDKATRKEITYGAVFRDIGEFDLLLQSGGASEKTAQLENFLGGQDMLRAGLLHDIGKVNIPPEILYKPGKLTPEEYEIMKLHPIYGEQIVRPIASLRYLCPTIRGHHERWDGRGYPDGLSGEQIPIAARIISVADVFDALSAERPYKRGMEVDKVKAILAEGRGTHFDPTLVDAFLGIIDRRYPDDEHHERQPVDQTAG